MRQMLFWISLTTTIYALPTAADNELSVPGATVSAARIDLEDEYRVGAEDLLQVTVFQVKDYDLAVRVNRHGDIHLPLIGAVPAAGQTGEQLEQAIAKRLSENFLQDPHVTVFIKEYDSQRVTLEGGINKPGIYALKGRTTLLQAIAQAEGLHDLANASEVQIFRVVSPGIKKQTVYDVEAIRDGEAADPLLKGDDIIVVHKSRTKAFVKGFTDTLRGFVSFGTLN